MTEATPVGHILVTVFLYLCTTQNALAIIYRRGQSNRPQTILTMKVTRARAAFMNGSAAATRQGPLRLGPAHQFVTFYLQSIH